MAKIDDLEFRITATTDALRTDLARGSQQVQQFTNRTDRQFTSLSNRFTQVAGKLRGIFSLFGIGFGVRVFAGWIKDAIEVEKLTAAQAVAIGKASKEMEGLVKGFGDLARVAVTELAPALERSAKFWKEIITTSSSQFGAAADAMREQVDAQIVAVQKLEAALDSANQKGWFVAGEEIANTTNLLAAARAELERLRGTLNNLRDVGTRTPNLQDQLRLAGMATENIGSMHRIMPSAELKQPKFDIDELFPIDELQPIIVQAREMTVDELLKPFPAAAVQKMWEPVKKEGKFTAEFIGLQFEDAFADWILGAERSFKDLLKRMAVQMATSAFFKYLSGLFAPTSFFADFFGGSRANEGPVSAGKFYKVHEGEGFFAPGRNGSVNRLAGAGAGGVVINQYNTFSGGSDSREQRAAMSAELARNNQRLKAEIKHEIGRGRI